MALYILSSILTLLPAVALQIRNIHEVIVIGAGISGLRASQVLTHHHIPHLVLQSSEQSGGRIKGIQFEGITVDKGASFIHSSQDDNPLGRMVQVLDWPCINRSWSYQQTFYENQPEGPISTQDALQAQNMYSHLVQSIQTHLENRSDISVQQAVNALLQQKYPTASDERRRLVLFKFQLLANIDGGEISQLSAKMRTYNESQHDILPATGFYQLFHTIFRDIITGVLFKHRVESIEYSSAIIKVQTNRGIFYARKVISSLPLGVLKAGQVKFIPSLPEGHRQAIANIGNGYADKLFVSLDRSFWGNHTGWLNFVTKQPQNKYPVAFIIPNHRHHLVFFVSGDASLTLSKWTNRQIIDDLSHFLSLFSNCNAQILAIKLTKWHSDQNSLGSYSNYKVGTTQQDFRELSRPIDDKIWMVGEHTTAKANSYAHGAYLSGEDAAVEVAGLLTKTQKTATSKAKNYKRSSRKYESSSDKSD